MFAFVKLKKGLNSLHKLDTANEIRLNLHYHAEVSTDLLRDSIKGWATFAIKLMVLSKGGSAAITTGLALLTI